MGKKHRDLRQELKREALRLRAQGWRETELGELARHGSKARARRAFVRRAGLMSYAERDILEAVQRRALEDIQRVEDGRVLACL